MKSFRTLILILAVVLAATAAWGQTMPAAGSSLTIGLVMVGPYNDQGWSQANYDAVQYVTNKVAGTRMVYIDKANSADRPGTTVSQLAESLMTQGAKLIIFSSDDMADEAVKFAMAHKDIFVIMSSGSQVWKDGKTYQDLPNMINVMGRMEFGKMIAYQDVMAQIAAQRTNRTIRRIVQTLATAVFLPL